MGLCAWALVCWQRSASEARRGPWLLGLWFTLSAAILCHYFPVLMLVPLAGLALSRRRSPLVPSASLAAASTLVLLMSVVFLRDVLAARLPDYW
mgnify:CR=1 FL=1